MNTLPTTNVNAVIGYPLAHTLSPLLHNAIYKKLDLNAEMIAIANNNVEELIKIIRTRPIGLTAVTIPHKKTIMQYLDEIDSVAGEIGAVNTVISRKGKLCGYNTDVAGIAAALRDVELKNKKVLILGAGGAARAAAWYAAKERAEIYYANRTEEEAKKLRNDFGGTVVNCHSESPFAGGEESLSQSPTDGQGSLVAARLARDDNYDVIVNTTPVGLFPNSEQSPLENFPFNSHQIVFDMVYNPRETKLLKDAEAASAKTISGIEMFVGQALEQIRLWSGKIFPMEKARDVLD